MEKEKFKNARMNETITKTAEKAWECLTLASNFIFCKVMMNKELCKKILSEILGVEVIRVEYPEYEKTIDARYDAKSIRLDVYLKDDKNTVYNIEIQNINSDNIPKRGRYYQGLIDLDLLEKGMCYEELNKSVVIFVCTFDLYKMGYYKYTFTNKCNEIPELEYGDDTTKIIINTLGTKGEVSKDFKEFLKAVNGQFSNSEFSDKIKMEVERVKRSNDARREFMTLYLHDEDIRRESLRQGRIEGKREGILQLLGELGTLSEELKNKIESEKDSDILGKWLSLAAKVSTLEEFADKITD